MNFRVEADRFIETLIHIQEHIRDRKGYRRSDQPAVNRYIDEIKYYKLTHIMTKDAGWLKFWERFRDKIRVIMPGAHYSGWESLEKKREELDEYQVNTWQSISEKLTQNYPL